MSTLTLPQGLTLGKRGKPLDSVASKSGELHLLVSGSNSEIVEGTLKQGERLTLVPYEPGQTPFSETVYLLTGALRCDLPDGAVTLTPGDTVNTEDLGQPVILTALQDIRFLFISPRPSFHEMSDSINALMRLAVEVEMKDGYTAEHCLRLQRLSFATGKVLGLDSHRLHLLDYGAYLHDVGKTKVPVGILQKPSKLDEDEWQIIKQHPTYGRELLDSTFMNKAGAIVEQHHERLDGSGYPFGFALDEVLVESYIVAVADTYDAMTTDRSYRKALAPSVAFEELDRYAGVHYPKDIVRAFREAVRATETIQK